MTKIYPNTPDAIPFHWPHLDPERQTRINRIAYTLRKRHGPNWNQLPYHPTEDRHLTLEEALAEWSDGALAYLDDELSRRED